MTTGAIGPGTVLGGRYRLDDLLSESDGARFWRGNDTVLGRSVAVNAVPSDDPRAGRLFDSARTSATVSEPHLLRVLDCDTRDGVTWVVNEWGDGTSLDIMLEHGPLPPSRAAWLTREVAEAIAAAHEAGVAHGRLTPESVLVTKAGAVKLIGFAVTAAIEGQAAEDPRAQARGHGSLTPREADVIDLAGILYAGLCGRWPGLSPSAVPVAPYDAGGPLRPRQVRAGVPRMLDALCARVLRKEAHEHVLPVETAQEVHAALSDQVGDSGAWAPSDPHSMHVEPTVAISREELRGLPHTGDPEATQAAPPPADEPHAPELPPYEEHPDRPLFASAERRPTPPAADRGSSVWLFGDDDGPGSTGSTLDPASGPAHAARRPVRTAVIAAIAVLVLVAMVLAFQLGRGNGGGPNPSSPSDSGSGSASPTGTLLRPAAVHDFDPEGQPSTENPDEVPRATDGDPATGWTTLTYASAELGGLKSGVGLLVDLGADRSVGSLRVTFRGVPTSYTLYAAPAGLDTPPSAVDGLRKVAGGVADRADTTVRPSSPVQTRFLVVWLTRLPAHGHGFRGEIDELSVRS